MFFIKSLTLCVWCTLRLCTRYVWQNLILPFQLNVPRIWHTKNNIVSITLLSYTTICISKVGNINLRASIVNMYWKACVFNYPREVVVVPFLYTGLNWKGAHQQPYQRITSAACTYSGLHKVVLIVGYRCTRLHHVVCIFAYTITLRHTASHTHKKARYTYLIPLTYIWSYVSYLCLCSVTTCN
jgi:hypothetical protein